MIILMIIIMMVNIVILMITRDELQKTARRCGGVGPVQNDGMRPTNLGHQPRVEAARHRGAGMTGVDPNTMNHIHTTSIHLQRQTT